MLQLFQQSATSVEYDILLIYSVNLKQRTRLVINCLCVIISKKVQERPALTQFYYICFPVHELYNKPSYLRIYRSIWYLLPSTNIIFTQLIPEVVYTQCWQGGGVELKTLELGIV